MDTTKAASFEAAGEAPIRINRTVRDGFATNVALESDPMTPFPRHKVEIGHQAASPSGFTVEKAVTSQPMRPGRLPTS